MVNVIDDGGNVLSRGRGNNDLLRAGVQMLLSLRAARVGSGTLENHVHTEFLPGELRCVGFIKDRNRTVADDQRVIRTGDFTPVAELSLARVVFEQVGDHFCIGQIIDRDDLEVILVEHLAEREPADDAETIDRNFQCHAGPPVIFGKNHEKTKHEL